MCLNFLQEYLASQHAWLRLSFDQFCWFLPQVFPELDSFGSLKRNDKFSTVRMFLISLMNIIQFGMSSILLLIGRSTFKIKLYIIFYQDK